MRHTIVRVMALTTGIDVEMLCGADQLASGLKAGIEGAVHAMAELYTPLRGSDECLFSREGVTQVILYPCLSMQLHL